LLKLPEAMRLLETSALEALHHDERLPLVLADVVDGADVGVVQGRGGSFLALESLSGPRFVESPFGEELQRHRAAQPRVLGRVDNPHASTAQFLTDTVVRNRLAGHALWPSPPGFWLPAVAAKWYTSPVLDGEMARWPFPAILRVFSEMAGTREAGWPSDDRSSP
jgi:hypothetical protein